MGTRIIMLEEL
jgi:hypothetical protein